MGGKIVGGPNRERVKWLKDERKDLNAFLVLKFSFFNLETIVIKYESRETSRSARRAFHEADRRTPTDFMLQCKSIYSRRKVWQSLLPLRATSI